MTIVWDKVSELATQIEQRLQLSGHALEDTHIKNYDWYNSVYSNLRYRRAHVEIVDHRESHKIYILHCTVFPHFNDPSPIWGFDAVCGRNKITGAFHDFSSAGNPHHPMMKWFADEAVKLSWNRPRDLPQWARAIFSPSMIAAGNIQDTTELDDLCSIALNSLDYYINNVGNTQESGADFHMAQNRYCRYQKQNPHVVKSMVSMGIPVNTIQGFVEDVLFPEV